MEQKEVIAFFDRLAPSWDAGQIRSDEKINRILDAAHVHEGTRVLDVACGTGVLIPDYLARNAASVLGVDISPKMIEIAQSKFDDARVTFCCADVETAAIDGLFDSVVVYNAFPHFPEPERLVRRLSGLLAPNGMLTVAHGMSRAQLAQHHSGPAHNVSVTLLPEQELAAIFAKYLTVTTVISNDQMYQVAGQRKMA